MDNRNRMFKLMNIDSSFVMNEEFNPIGGVIENNNSKLEIYFNNVIDKLIEIDSGEKLINVVKNKQKYFDTIKRNFENGFDSSHTANAIRDHWYGV